MTQFSHATLRKQRVLVITTLKLLIFLYILFPMFGLYNFIFKHLEQIFKSIVKILELYLRITRVLTGIFCFLDSKFLLIFFD